MKRLVILLTILISTVLIWRGISPILQKSPIFSESKDIDHGKVLQKEPSVTEVVRKVGPSVVTIGVIIPPSSSSSLNDPFSLFFNSEISQESQNESTKEDFIGSGFVLTREGLIATNKHVVSDDGAYYIVVDIKGKKYKVVKIYRDPANDFAILKTEKTPTGGFKAAELGDSAKLEVGQFAIAIGTALGEFSNTVTTGVVSGLGRGITAGSVFQGFAERLDNVIQTDAAINPGNSGGPLLNSYGQVIGINTAVAQNGQNIGFAIPINIVKESIENFNNTGQFNRPYLGISYTMLSRQAALLNELPEGAYVQEVIPDSSADKAGIKSGDILTHVDGEKLRDQSGGLAAVISRKKIGDIVAITYYRKGKTQEIEVRLHAVSP
ncbi:MAG TPA: trypsin-like peptidase domain-containing protein [Candidatus Levybacteria bacterium]|nr:trypsin-like peptidase domain-containing protein [Candidatus Levybacteria bacterium]